MHGRQLYVSGPATVEEVRSHGVALVLDSYYFRLSGPRALPPEMMQRIKAAKPVLVFELRAVLPWWRDPDAIRLRFEEIAAQAEYDNGADRDEAERLALEALARELRDGCRLSDATAMRTLKAIGGKRDG